MKKKNIKELVNEKKLMSSLMLPHEMIQDVVQISTMITLFKMKYGIELEVTYKK